jgi:hypothetical protein
MTNVASISSGTGWKPAGAFFAFGLAAAISVPVHEVTAEERGFLRVVAGNASTNDGHLAIKAGAASRPVRRDFAGAVSRVFDVMAASQVEVDPEILEVVSRDFWELFEE